MGDRVQAVKGMNDALPPDGERLNHVFRVGHRVLRSYGYRTIVTPVVEYTRLFARAVGETTDMIEKEMYTFDDRDGRSLSLRPEGTAGAIRAYVQHAVHKAEPVTKWYYAGPMFRHERPQRGRYRQFHQIGAEALGVAEPGIDAEMVIMLVDLLSGLGVEGAGAKISSLGCAICRPRYRARLADFLSTTSSTLCEDCQRRLRHNPLRVLDCKKAGCAEARAGAPSTLDELCGECRAHLDAVLGDLRSVRVPYEVDGSLVRGLDYYTRTTFEVVSASGELGTQNALLGGGRYDALVEELGGPSVPAIGFAMGVERVLLAVPDLGNREPTDVFVVALGEAARRWAVGQVRALRSTGLTVDLDHRGGSAKRQLRRADNVGARVVVLVGDDEITRGTAAIKDLRTGDQREVPQSQIAARIDELLRSP